MMRHERPVFFFKMAVMSAIVMTRGLLKSLQFIVLVVVFALNGYESIAHAEKVRSPGLAQGTVSSPDPGTVSIVTVMAPSSGPGKFISAMVRVGQLSSALGPTVRLLIDGQVVVEHSLADGLAQNNPYGVAIFEDNAPGIPVASDGSKQMTIGFPMPLRFESTLELEAIVNSIDEGKIVFIKAFVIHAQ